MKTAGVGQEEEAGRLPRGATHNIGRRRLGVLLCTVSGGLCAAAMLLLLIVYGTPHNPMWWWVMGGLLAVAAVGPIAVVPVVEWVIAGYLEDRGEDGVSPTTRMNANLSTDR